VRKALEDPNWGSGISGIRAGRDMAKEIIETYYAKKRGLENFKSVASYADFRELLEDEKDLDAVKIMTPDHLHATIAIAAMKKRKNVLVHKPLSNRVEEVRMVVDTAHKTGVATHLLAWRAPLTAVRQMILDGAIGIVRITRATLTPYFAVGTISAGAASRTWATTACGRSSWRWNCRSRIALKRNPARALKSMTR
jgi:predicted dehydrogenase